MEIHDQDTRGRRKQQISSKIFLQSKYMLALIKAVKRFKPWSATHKEKLTAWQNVADDFNAVLLDGSGSMTAVYARKQIEKAIDQYSAYLEKLESGNEFVSGHTFDDPIVTAAMVELIDMKKEIDHELVDFNW